LGWNLFSILFAPAYFVPVAIWRFCLAVVCSLVELNLTDGAATMVHRLGWNNYKYVLASAELGSSDSVVNLPSSEKASDKECWKRDSWLMGMIDDECNFESWIQSCVSIFGRKMSQNPIFTYLLKAEVQTIANATQPLLIQYRRLLRFFK
jgi:hypothetical protein